MANEDDIVGLQEAFALMAEGASQDQNMAARSPEHDDLLEEVRNLMQSILDSRPHPTAATLNRLAAIIEEEEFRCQQNAGFGQTSSRGSSTIGRIVPILKEDDEYIDVLSDFVMTGPRAVRAAAARLLIASSSCWGFDFPFDDELIATVKQQIVDHFENLSYERADEKRGKSPAKDTELWSTYSIGLFAVILSRSDIAEEILSTEIPTKFLRYLRYWTLGDAGRSEHKDAKSRNRHLTDGLEKRTSALEDHSLDAATTNHVEEREDDERKGKREGKLRLNHREEAHDETGRGKNDVRDRKNRGKAKVVDGENDRVSRKDKNRGKPEQHAEDDTTKIDMVENVDISHFVRMAVTAAKNEARLADAPDEAVKAAEDAAADAVKNAAFEAWTKTKSEEEVSKAAEAAAVTVVDAALSVLRAENEALLAKEDTPINTESMQEDEEPDENALDSEALAFLKAQFCVQCLEKLGEYLDLLGPVLQERGIEVCLTLLRRHSQASESVKDMAMVSDVLKLVCALAAHRKFATTFVDSGGVRQLLDIPRVPQTLIGISLCLFAVASIQAAMERVCAITPPVVHDIVSLAFQLLECPQETSRRNAALFLASSFVFRSIIEEFEAQDGIRKFLNVLRNILSLRSGGERNAEVLTASDKQIAFHTCVALRQYFRAGFLLLVDSLRPLKWHRGANRSTSNSRASSKPIDVSNEAVENVIQQISRDKKLGAAFVRAKWPALDSFTSNQGEVLLLELTQMALGGRYLHEIAQPTLAILQIVTLMPTTRKKVYTSTISDGRSGMSVILNAASGVAFPEPEAIQAALLVLVNLVCPPPAFSSRSGSNSSPTGLVTPTPASLTNGQSSSSGDGTLSSCGSQLVGDTRISLGGAGGPGLAAFMEQSYRCARESVRSNNGIKVLLSLLSRTGLPRPAQDCIRALACRVLLGLARDEAIAQILTKLQVGKLLSELLKDGSLQAKRQTGGDQDRWQSELSQAALDLIGIVTNAGRANTVASEAAAPTLRRIERAGIAAATPINYHPRELLQLIHEHLLASGLTISASTLSKEAQLTPLSSLLPVGSLHNGSTHQDTQPDHKKDMQWPSGRIKHVNDDDKHAFEGSARKKAVSRPLVTPRKLQESQAGPSRLSTIEEKTPRTVPAKRRPEVLSPTSPNKRQNTSNGVFHFNGIPQRGKSNVNGEPSSTQAPSTPGQQDTGSKTWEESCEHLSHLCNSGHVSHQSLLVEPTTERATLDSLVVQYLKHQHRQCPAPITTLPPLSLLHPHVCPEPSRLLDAPYNTCKRLGARQINPPHGGMHGSRHNRHFIYSRFKQVRISRDEENGLLTCATFLGQTPVLAAGCQVGYIRLFDTATGNLIDAHNCHGVHISDLQASPFAVSAEGGFPGHLLLSSSNYDVKLWNSGSLATGSLQTFDSIKGAAFNHAGTLIGAYNMEPQTEVLLYDVNTYQLRATLTDSSYGLSRSHPTSMVHFSPSDILLLWSGVLWDHRVPTPIHRFDQFTDYGGGGFHPDGNEVIINSEVWDLRTYKLLRSVPSLDNTDITFNSSGDVIYSILRRSQDDTNFNQLLGGKRARHSLFSAFRTMDAVDYSDIATVQVDRCVLDIAVDDSNSTVGVVALDNNQVGDSYVKYYEVGRRKPTDDDSDPDDGVDTDEESDVEDDEDDIGAAVLRGDGSSSDSSDDDHDNLSDASDSALAGGGILEFIDDIEDDRSDYSRSEYDSDESDGGGGINGIIHGLL